MTALPRMTLSIAGSLGAVALAVAALHGQQEFQFVIAASDANGRPVTDLKTEEISMFEAGKLATIVKVEPFRMPVKLTIAVDNSSDSREALAHYRSGLTGLIEALPQDVEVTIVATAPQPRMIVRDSTNRQATLRSVTLVAPEDERPRFTDALVEYSQRLEKSLREKRVIDGFPIMVVISTTANEVTSYQVPEIEKALNFLANRRARLMVVVTTGRATADAAAVADINTNRQALLAIPATKATGGKFEALAVSSRLATLLPEWGKEIAALHTKHSNQVRVTAHRPDGVTGPLQNPRIEVLRPGIIGSVSLEGLP